VSNRDSRRFADRYWDDLLELKPLHATQIGDERFDDRLPSISEDARARALSVHGEALATADRLLPSAADAEERLALLMVAGLARNELSAIETRYDRFQVLSHMWGPGTILATLSSMQATGTPERLERYLARLRSFRAYLDDAIDLVAETVAAGQAPTRAVVARTLAQVDGLLAAGVEQSPALACVDADDDAARASVAAVLEDVVLPAYRDFRDAVADTVAAAPETFGLCALPEGEAMYRAKVRESTSIYIEPDEIHALGWEELERMP
jgi:uncharacterized protein (DUF885 family)